MAGRKLYTRFKVGDLVITNDDCRHFKIGTIGVVIDIYEIKSHPTRSPVTGNLTKTRAMKKAMVYFQKPNSGGRFKLVMEDHELDDLVIIDSVELASNITNTDMQIPNEEVTGNV